MIQMTDAIVGRMRGEEARLLHFVHYTIAADLARSHGPQRAQEVKVDVDVERLFASIDLLVDRYNQPWSPLIATWHPGLESFSPQPSLSQHNLFIELNNFERALKDAQSPQSRYSGFSSLRGALVELLEKAAQGARPSDVSALLAQVRDQMLRSLFELLSIDDRAKIEYLSPVIELGRRQGSLTIATLNYDRSIENAAELLDEHCDTAIESWLARGELDWSGSGLRLLKLHGSIDWVVEPDRPQRQLPVTQIPKVADAEEKGWYDRPAVVFGEAGKLWSEGPYLELLACAAELKRTQCLLTVGYSFRDAHVNEVIARWFNADASRQIVLVDPTDPGAAERG
jgi:SIR2-like domain